MSLINRLKNVIRYFCQVSCICLEMCLRELYSVLVCVQRGKAVCSRVLCLTGVCAHHVLMASAFHFLYSFGLCIIF